MSKYTVRSSSLKKYISEKYIYKNDALGGATFLKEVMRLDEKNKRYFDQLALVTADLNHIRELKTTGVLSIVNGVPINAAANKLLMLLSSIEREQPNVLIKKGELKRLAPGQFSPQRVGSKEKQKPKNSPSIPLALPLFKWKLKPKIILIIGAFVLLSGLAYAVIFDADDDSPLSQVTSWKNPQAKKWAVYLRSFKTLKDAKLEQGAFLNRPIDIVKLNDNRFYLFILTDSEQEAQKELTSTVKEHWKRSRVIPFDRCFSRQVPGQGYFECR